MQVGACLRFHVNVRVYVFQHRGSRRRSFSPKDVGSPSRRTGRGFPIYVMSAYSWG